MKEKSYEKKILLNPIDGLGDYGIDDRVQTGDR